MTRNVVVSFSCTRARLADGWWVTVTAGDGRRDFGPYADEHAAIEATGELLHQMVDPETGKLREVTLDDLKEPHHD
jgi:hypothetical protein